MSNEDNSENTLRFFLGIDVAKATFDAAFADGRCAGTGIHPTSLPVRNFPRTQQGVQDLLAWAQTLAPQQPECEVEFLAVMEATGMFSTELAAWLVTEDTRVRPAIVNPHDAAHHRKSLGLRNNTDKLAARALALFGVERRPQPYQALTPQRSELRALSRYRDHLVQQRTAFKNRLKDTVVSKWVRKQEEAQLRRLDKDVARVEKQMRAHVDAHEDLKRDVELLVSIPGVAFLTATVVLSEVGDLRHFGRARPLAAFVGVSPEHNESGTSVRGRVRMSKKGNGRARQSLYLAALTAIRYPSDLSKTYHRLRGQGKPPKAALGAVMRKLLIIMRAICIADRPFEAQRACSGKICGKPVENTAEAN
jgi:transposase